MSALAGLVLLAQASSEQMVRGRVPGGWGYVWVSYGITWGALSLYSLSLWLRRPKNSPAGQKE